jgi:hypothetical protein
MTGAFLRSNDEPCLTIHYRLFITFLDRWPRTDRERELRRMTAPISIGNGGGWRSYDGHPQTQPRSTGIKTQVFVREDYETHRQELERLDLKDGKAESEAYAQNKVAEVTRRLARVSTRPCRFL